jgi:hypothetical protein
MTRWAAETLVGLQVNLFRGYYDGFSAEISLPDGDRSSWTLAPPPLESLKAAAGPQEQGKQLFQWLFQGVEDTYRRGREWFDPVFPAEAGSPLRMRFCLGLDSQAAVLYQFPWETLYDEKRPEFLSLSLAFSRLLRMRVPRSSPVPERPLRLLAAGAAEGVPEDKKDLLQVLRVDEPLTLARLKQEQQPGYHILHLWARATPQGSAEGLTLAADGGNEEVVPFARVAEAVAPKTGKPPALVFWAMPSAAAGPGAAVTANLAAALLEAGVQAVVTAPGGRALGQFTRQFYEVLLETGAVDVAVAAARSLIHVPGQWGWTYPLLYPATWTGFAWPNSQGQWDWTYPVLYLRTAEAQLFQRPLASF